MIIELPDGQELEFPDNTSPEVMRNAIYKNFPQYAPKEESKKPSVMDVFSSALKGLHPESSYSKEVQEARKTPIGQALELPLFLAAPELEIPGLSGALGKLLPRAGKYLTKGIQTAVPQAGLSAGSAALSGESPLEPAAISAGISAPFAALSASSSPVARTIMKSLMGIGGGVLGYGGAKKLGAPEWGALTSGAAGALGGYKGLNPFRRAREDVLKGVEGTPYKEALQAADRLGLSYITPAEASGSPFVGATQGIFGKTPKGAQILYNKGEERAASEQKALKHFLDTIYNVETQSPLRESLYKVATEKKAPPHIFGLGKNEIFKSAEKKMLADPAYKEELKSVPRNSVGYLDLVKREMDDMIRKSGIGTNEARLIGKTKDKLVEGLDKFSPQYKEARGIAERGIVRKNLENYFKKKESSMTGSNFAKFISNEKNYEKLQHNLRNVPEAQQQLKDMKLIFKKLINIPTAKTAEALARTSMSKDRATSAAIMRNLKEFISAGQYDKSAVNLMTNPKWDQELELLKQFSNEDLALLGKILSGSSR